MTRLKQAFVLALLAVQLSAGLLAEAFHSDTAIGGGRGVVFTSHDCESRERHHPLGNGHDCQTCLLNAHRLTLQPPVVPGAGPLPFLIAPRDPGQARTRSTCPYTIIPRGPPAA